MTRPDARRRPSKRDEPEERRGGPASDGPRTQRHEGALPFELEGEVTSLIEALFGDAPDGVAISHAGRIVYSNGRLVEMLGAPDAMLGRASLELYPESEYAAVLRQIQAMVFSGRPQPPTQLDAQCADGSTTRVEVARMLLPVGDESLIVEIVRALGGAGEADRAES